jgi:hypothetical protein
LGFGEQSLTEPVAIAFADQALSVTVGSCSSTERDRHSDANSFAYGNKWLGTRSSDEFPNGRSRTELG